jgi:hypothetical protein
VASRPDEKAVQLIGGFGRGMGDDDLGWQCGGCMCLVAIVAVGCDLM